MATQNTQFYGYKMKNKKYHNVEIIPKCKVQSAETETK